MSTRSIIARAGTRGHWQGRYHHWDGYPEGLGAELFHIRRWVFGGDTARMLEVLIDEHPGGWSTIIGADWSKPAGANDPNITVCVSCGQELWRHYRQYYGADSRYSPGEQPPTGRADPENPVLVLGHSADRSKRPDAPACYCHPAGPKEDHILTDAGVAKGHDCGAEWIYVIDPTDHVMYVYELAMAFFGMSSGATPKLASAIRLEGPEPDWSRVRATGLAGRPRPK